MTIKDSAVLVLRDRNMPMFAEDILMMILSKELYDFGAENPLSVLRIEIARSCDNMHYSKEYSTKLFHREIDGRFSLNVE